MEKDIYFCDHCRNPYDVEPDSTGAYICPKCHKKMSYWITEIFDETGKYIRSEVREQPKPSYDMKYITTGVPTIECPYCHSTNTKKISGFSRGFAAGLLGLGSSSLGKQWHCNRCDSDF